MEISAVQQIAVQGEKKMASLSLMRHQLIWVLILITLCSRVWSSLDEQFMRELLAATPKAMQKTNSERADFEQSLH